MSGTPYPKQPMHRIAYTKLTREQIGAKLGPVAAHGPTSLSPLATDFAGRTLRIVTDGGPTLSYKFTSNSKLSVTEDGAKAVNAGFGALEMDTVCFFTHLVPGTPARLRGCR